MAVTLASFDGTPSEVAADALLVVVVLVNAYLGWRSGLLRRLLAAAGVYVGCFAATNLGNPLATLVRPHSSLADAWSFVAVLVFVVLVVEILGAVLNERLQRVAVAAFDRIGGVLVGAAVGLGEVLVLFLVALAVIGPPIGGTASYSAAVGSAELSGRAIQLEPWMRTVLSPVVPRDLAAHLQAS